MSTANLAQHEQYLKSLEQSFKEISDQHKRVHAALLAVQNIAQEARQVIGQSWSNVILLFELTDQLRSTRHEEEREND